MFNQRYFVMITTIQVTSKRVKTFQQISIQCERILTMHFHGYGTKTMIERVETIFFKEMKKNGGY